MVHVQRLGPHMLVQRAIAAKTTAAKTCLAIIINVLSSFLRVPPQVQLSPQARLHILLHPLLLPPQLQRLPQLLVTAVYGTSTADGVPMMTHCVIPGLIRMIIAALIQAIFNKARVPIATSVMEDNAQLCLLQKRQLQHQLQYQLLHQLLYQLLHQLHHRLKSPQNHQLTIPLNIQLKAQLFIPRNHQHFIPQHHPQSTQQ
mmetsp:Transcript_976/g.1531  ORF Transcript_976/g.1531 Transcript_976/m.1531 type:complete len:201 (+) Transcript_976:1003-1605(+)